MLTKDYIAGFTDGEGYISIRKVKPVRKQGDISPRYNPVFYIGNTNEKILKEIKKVYGGFIHKRKANIKRNWKIYYSLTIVGPKAFSVLEDLKNHLIVKKHIAEKILEYKKYFGWKSYKRGNQYKGNHTIPKEILKKRNEIYEWCKNANKRGL